MYSNISLTMAFFLGAFHAFQPGHGKSILAAYLIGSRGRIIDALWLGLILTIAHTFSVIILGVIIKVAYGAVMTAVIQPSSENQTIPVPGAKIIRLIAGVLILGIGIWIILNRNRILTHEHYSPDKKSGQSLWQLLLLGISGGMVPCAEGIGLLLKSIADGQAEKGLILVLSFSLGVALVVVTIGIIICKLTSIAENVLQRAGKWVTKLPLVSGSVIAILGCYSIIRVLISL